MTQQEYLQRLNKLAESDPNNILLDTLMEGFSTLNQIYLEAAEEGVGSENEAEATNSIQNTKAALAKLYEEKRNIRGQRAKLSNAMVALNEQSKHDKQRAKLSDQILALNAQMKTVIARIETAESGTPTTIPEQAVEMNEEQHLRRLFSLRSAISRKKKQLRIEKNKEKLAQHQKSLTALEQQLQILEQTKTAHAL